MVRLSPVAARRRKRANDLKIVRSMNPAQRLHAFFSLCESGAALRRMGRDAR